MNRNLCLFGRERVSDRHATQKPKLEIYAFMAFRIIKHRWKRKAFTATHAQRQRKATNNGERIERRIFNLIFGLKLLWKMSMHQKSMWSSFLLRRFRCSFVSAHDIPFADLELRPPRIGTGSAARVFGINYTIARCSPINNISWKILLKSNPFWIYVDGEIHCRKFIFIRRILQLSRVDIRERSSWMTLAELGLWINKNKRDSGKMKMKLKIHTAVRVGVCVRRLPQRFEPLSPPCTHPLAESGNVFTVATVSNCC